MLITDLVSMSKFHQEFFVFGRHAKSTAVRLRRPSGAPSSAGVFLRCWPFRIESHCCGAGGRWTRRQASRREMQFHRLSKRLSRGATKPLMACLSHQEPALSRGVSRAASRRSVIVSRLVVGAGRRSRVATLSAGRSGLIPPGGLAHGADANVQRSRHPAMGAPLTPEQGQHDRAP
jgi:hypothetical protein